MMFKGKTADYSEEIELLGFSADQQPNDVSITGLNILSSFCHSALVDPISWSCPGLAEVCRKKKREEAHLS